MISLYDVTMIVNYAFPNRFTKYDDGFIFNNDDTAIFPLLFYYTKL